MPNDNHFDAISIKEFVNTETGTLTDSAAADIKCDARIKIQFNGTVYYLPLYDTAP